MTFKFGSTQVYMKIKYAGVMFSLIWILNFIAYYVLLATSKRHEIRVIESAIDATVLCIGFWLWLRYVNRNRRE
jgi:hypothetical protein